MLLKLGNPGEVAGGRVRRQDIEDDIRGGKFAKQGNVGGRERRDPCRREADRGLEMPGNGGAWGEFVGSFRGSAAFGPDRGPTVIVLGVFHHVMDDEPANAGQGLHLADQVAHARVGWKGGLKCHVEFAGHAVHSKDVGGGGEHVGEMLQGGRIRLDKSEDVSIQACEREVRECLDVHEAALAETLEAVGGGHAGDPEPRAKGCVGDARVCLQLGDQPAVEFVESRSLTIVSVRHGCPPLTATGCASAEYGAAVAQCQSALDFEAERAAALDILSPGRLDFGTGRSATALELRAFEIDTDDTRPRWEEAIQAIPKFWTEERLAFKGKYYDIPKRTVLPKPHQKPHPPLWMAGGQPASVALAAKYGLGFLHFTLLDPEQTFAYVKQYREELKNAVPPGGMVNNQFAAFTIGYCGDDEVKCGTSADPGRCITPASGRASRARGRRRNTVQESYSHYQKPTEKIDLTSKDALPGLLNLGSMAVGTAGQCRRLVDIYDKAGIDQLILYVELPFLKHEQIMKSVRLFGERVIQPYKADHGSPRRDPRRARRWSARRSYRSCRGLIRNALQGPTDVRVSPGRPSPLLPLSLRSERE